MKLKKGFTLVELLIAIAIFAVLSALGWKVFDHISRVKERNIAREQVLANLQTAYQILLKDSVQIIPITANINNEIQPAMLLQNEQLTFNKSGVIDPLQQGRAPFERIEYGYDEKSKSIVRLRYRNVNRSNDEKPEQSVFLDNVDEFNVVVLNPGELSTWPNDSDTEVEDDDSKKLLPRGLKFTFTQNGTKYEWLFSLLDTNAVAQKLEKAEGQ